MHYRIANIWKYFLKLLNSAARERKRDRLTCRLNYVFKTRKETCIVSLLQAYFCSRIYTLVKRYTYDILSYMYTFLNKFFQIKECNFDKRMERCLSENIPFYPIQRAQAFQTFRLISTLRFFAARKGKEPTVARGTTGSLVGG